MKQAVEDRRGNQVIATATLERLLHHATTINIKGENYRLKEKRRAGLLKSERPVGSDQAAGAEPTQQPEEDEANAA